MANREFIYGRQPVREVLRAGKRRIRAIYVAATAKSNPEIRDIMDLVTEAGILIERVKRHRLDQMAGNQSNHQGVVLETGGYRYVEWRDIAPRILHDATSHNHTLLFLDRIQDPQNLGSLLRTADAVGVDLVVLPKERAAHVTPAVVRASAGASEHVIVSIVSNLVKYLKEIHAAGFQIIGLESAPESVALSDLEACGDIALVVGSEGRGLRRLVKENCSSLAAIPMRGCVNSLNAAIAGAVALYGIGSENDHV